MEQTSSIILLADMVSISTGNMAAKGQLQTPSSQKSNVIAVSTACAQQKQKQKKQKNSPNHIAECQTNRVAQNI